MNKKLLELLDKINAKKVDVKNLVDAGKLDEATTAKAELVNMQKQFDLLKDLSEEEGAQAKATAQPKAPEKVDAVKAFANAARHGFKNAAALGESINTELGGAYVVPQDIQTQINKKREATFSLASLVATEKVSTNSGSRTFKKRSQYTGFTKVGEGGKIGAVDGPKFEKVDYSIEKYAGYLPVTNELLADSDQNITAVLTDWLANDDLATRNKLIYDAINALDAVQFSTLDDIKRAINVTLGSKFAGSVKIVTNDDGLQLIDMLKDKNGNYILKPNADQTSPMKNVLAVGTSSIPVVVVPNEVIASKGGATGQNIPFIIGSLTDAVRLFDRQQITLKVSDEAATSDFNAFEEDLTLIRAIDRLDVKVVDRDAVINGYAKDLTVGE